MQGGVHRRADRHPLADTGSCRNEPLKAVVGTSRHEQQPRLEHLGSEGHIGIQAARGAGIQAGGQAEHAGAKAEGFGL